MNTLRKTVLIVGVLALVAGCAPQAQNLAQPDRFGLPGDVQKVAGQFEKYDVYASTARGWTTALVFDPKEDAVSISPEGTWYEVQNRTELTDRIAEMQAGFGNRNRLMAILGADQGQAAGLVYTPAPTVAVGRDEPGVVTVRDVDMERACVATGLIYGSDPCYHLHNNK
ncbi:MAG: hypothetical protein ACLFTB_01870 [Desulfovibrionales bacterium]